MRCYSFCFILFDIFVRPADVSVWAVAANNALSLTSGDRLSSLRKFHKLQSEGVQKVICHSFWLFDVLTRHSFLRSGRRRRSASTTACYFFRWLKYAVL